MSTVSQEDRLIYHLKNLLITYRSEDKYHVNDIEDVKQLIENLGALPIGLEQRMDFLRLFTRDILIFAVEASEAHSTLRISDGFEEFLEQITEASWNLNRYRRVLRYIEHTDVEILPDYLQNWIKKLKHCGKPQH